LLSDNPAMGLFSLGRQRNAAASEISRRIAAQVRAVLALGEDDAVSVSEIDCGDAACEGGAETIILIMRKGQRTHAAKISKAMIYVTDEEIPAAVARLRG
jgi:hypothetical protein